MSDAEKLQARRAELEALWEKVFKLSILSGKGLFLAEEAADRAIEFGVGSTQHRDFVIDRVLKVEGLLHDQS